ncbi:uncharacterized protein, partial [Parasteatoda tepidariorum]|uniref:uncharacterized protein n=1 Tax=Parasteatoda tepidariorum TaxID=114398 RepID=UPI0039BCFB99
MHHNRYLFSGPPLLDHPRDSKVCIFRDDGVFSEASSFYAPVRQGSAFDGEIALVQLQCHIDLFVKAVVLCDSRAALLATASLNNPLTRDNLDCYLQLVNLASLKKTIVLQWVPAHCGVT